MSAMLPRLYLSTEGRDRALEYMRTPDVFGWAYTGWHYLSEENPIIRSAIHGLSNACKAETEEIKTLFDTALMAGAGVTYFAFREDSQPAIKVTNDAVRLMFAGPAEVTTTTLSTGLLADDNLLEVAYAVSCEDTDAFDLRAEISPFSMGAGSVRLLLEYQLIADAIRLN